MKNIILLIGCFFLFTLAVKSQSYLSTSNVPNGTSVQVAHAADFSFSMIFKGSENIWDEVRDTLISQLGQYEFERVKKNITISKMPCAMALLCKGRIKNSDSVLNKLSTLKVQKVASYIRHHLDGSIGSYDLIRVPYPENKDWDISAVWDTVYFQVKSGSFQAVKPGMKTKLLPYTVKFPQATINDWTKLIHVSKEWPRSWHLEASDFGKQSNTTTQNTVSVIFQFLKPFPAFDINNYSSFEKYSNRMNELKIYYVGEIKGEDGRKYKILRIPYKENTSWDVNITWDNRRDDTQYIIAAAEVVSLKESGFIEKL